MATMADLKKAFSVKRPKPPGTEVDLGKVATLVLEATNKAQEGDDDAKAAGLLADLVGVVKAAEELVGKLTGDDELGYFAPEGVEVADAIKAGFPGAAPPFPPKKPKKGDPKKGDPKPEVKKGAQPFQAELNIAPQAQEWDPVAAVERVTAMAKDENGVVDLVKVRFAFLWAPEDETDVAKFQFPICDVEKSDDPEEDDDLVIVEAALDLVVGEEGLLAKAEILDDDRLEIKKSLCRYFSRLSMARDDELLMSGYEDEVAKAEEAEVMGKGDEEVDDDGWLIDMSPEHAPSERGERMLKSEVPNRGDRRAKHAEIREKVRARSKRTAV